MASIIDYTMWSDLYPGSSAQSGPGQRPLAWLRPMGEILHVDVIV